LARAVPSILIILWLLAIFCTPAQLKAKERISFKSEIENLSIKTDRINSEVDHLKDEVSNMKSRCNDQTTANKPTTAQIRK
jgi:hypothetical protein